MHHCLLVPSITSYMTLVSETIKMFGRKLYIKIRMKYNYMFDLQSMTHKF